MLLLGALSALTGCRGGEPPSQASLKLQREDLAAVCQALQGVQRTVNNEVAATKAAWPLIVDGLRAGAIASERTPIATAAANAARLKLPALLEQAQATSLTGPASAVAGLFREYVLLAMRGWRLIGAAVQEIERGSPASARFASENVALYIESVYDAHFTLSQLGKSLLGAYRKLGGRAAFGGALPAAEVGALARTYSEPSDRLYPHVGVRLGS
ncbi:MAG: hypothetical protein M3Z95_00295 [Actinomycetota bacterium]|nr:hypothetical protein [Actinomycetota bacterium]